MPDEKERKTKKFILHWLNGDTQTIEGVDIEDAFNRAGIGNGALPALDYWEPVKDAAQKS